MNIRILLFVLFFGISLNGFSQDYYSEQICVRVNKFSVEKRNQNYPYNKASRIAFVSFKGDYKKLPEEEQIGVVQREYNDVFVMDGAVMEKYFDVLKKDFLRYNPKDFEESVDLNETQKNELTDLVFNYYRKKDLNVIMGNTCMYAPRNAILFFDEKDELFAFVDICFMCGDYRTNNRELFDLGDDCSDKMKLLQNLFEKVGIKYGVE